MTRHYYTIYNNKTGFWEVWDFENSYRVQDAISYKQALEFEKMFEYENYTKLQQATKQLLTKIKEK